MKRFVGCLVAALAAAGPGVADDSDAPLLKKGVAIERELVGGDRHAYRVRFKSGQFFFAIVDQRGIDVVLRITGPDGEQVAELDSPNGPEGPEPITLMAPQPGEYRIEVRPFDDGHDAGRYAVEVLRHEKAARTHSGKVNQLVAPWDRPDSPGAAVAVTQDGEIVYERGFGSAQLEYEVPITPTTVFHVASVSKQFTAFAVTLLADQGKLSLDDDIREYLPELHDFGTTITIRHLIHHTSGLRDQWTLLAMAGWRLDDVITLEHIMKLVRKQRELNFEPGAEHLYSNTGYTLLAEIVARVSGRSLREWTTKNIFEPLGMRQTHFHDDHEMIVPHRAYSYGSAPGGFRKSVLSFANVGATSLFTTVGDLARWMRNLDDGKLGADKIREQMHENGVLNDYAFGLVHGEHNGLPTVSHGGADAGFRSFVTRYPEQGLGVVVLSNLGNFNTGSIATRIAEIYLTDRFETAEGHDGSPVEPEIASDTVEAEIDPALYDDYAGEYKIAAGLVISITREEDRLMGQAPGQPRVQLTPKSETRFAVEDLRADVTFERDESGHVNRLVLHQGDEETSAKRLEPFAAEQLDLYAGAYTSNELETTYTLVPEEGKLLARHMRHPDIELKPTAKDEFTGNEWFFGTLTFERDETNHITGFRLSSGRVRNLLFTR
jgi:CubicO group peptidase (beta-lactamase class C family)